MGHGSMIKAWLRIIRGKEPELFLELSPGKLDGRKLSSSELREKGRYRLRNKWETCQTALGFLSDLIGNLGGDRRTIFFSTSLIEKLQDRHNDAIKTTYGQENLHLTNGDIIAGLLMKRRYFLALL